MKRSSATHSTHASSGNESYGMARAITASALCGAASAVFTLLMIAIYSFAAISLSDPKGLISISGIAIPAISYFAAGVSAHRVSRRAPLICGIVSAAVLATLLKLVSLALKPSESARLGGAAQVIFCFVYALMSIIGAVISANISVKRSGKRPHSHT